jgi:hypothetical protein
LFVLVAIAFPAAASGERTLTTTAGGDWFSPQRTEHEAVNIVDTVTSYLLVEPR